MTIEELLDILVSDKPSEILKNNEESLFKLIPELRRCKGFNQNNIWHPYDVLEHIYHVVDGVPSELTLRLAALFHDVGKPSTYTLDDNKVGHFYNHWVESKRIFDSSIIFDGLDEALRNLISNLIYYHDISVPKLNDDDLKALYQVLGKDGIRLLFVLKRADLMAQNPEFHYILDDYSKQEQKLLSIGELK